jgi:plastocyanin
VSPVDTRKGKKVSMKKLIVLLASVALLAFAIVGCGKPVGGSSTTPATGGGCTDGKIEMASADFVQHTCTIKAGGQITFVDPQTTGNFHILCFGTNEACVPNPDGPAELNDSSGVTFNAGDPPKSFTFSKPGTYTVTCTVHRNMDVTITVQ